VTDSQIDKMVGRYNPQIPPKKGVAGQARVKYTSHSRTHTYKNTLE